MRKIDELKMKLKEMGLGIRKIRTELKNDQRMHGYKGYILNSDLGEKKYVYRHHHIAYSELRGKTREQIEKPKENNYPNESYVKEIKALYAWEENNQVQEAK